MSEEDLNKRIIRVGLVGLHFGVTIANQLVEERDRFKLEAVCDLDTELAEREAKRLGVRTIPDLEAVLADPAIDAVALITPPGGRANLMRKCLAAGKPVITTKPFELDADAAVAVLQEAEEAGIPVHINSPSPLPSPDLAKIAQWREQYDLGIPVGVRGDVWAGYGRPKADGSWYDDPIRCPVAPVFRLGIYLINDLVRIFGVASVVSVMSSRLMTERPTADNAQLAVKFANGALGNIFASFCVHDGDAYRNSLTLNFERGTVYRNAGPSRNGNGAELSLVVQEEGCRKIAETCQCVPSGLYQWDSFYKAICEGPLPDTISPEQVGNAIRVINAMAASEQSGHPENIK